MIAEDFYGGSTFDVIAAHHQMQPVARLQLIQPVVASLEAYTPDARQMQLGIDPLIVVNASVTETFAVKTHTDHTLLATLTPTQGIFLALYDNSTAPGGWSVHHTSPSFSIGAFIPSTRETYGIVLSADENNVNIKDKLIALGWGQVNPVKAAVKVVNNSTIGADGAGIAMDTGSGYPAGSVVTLHVTQGSAVRGYGGSGGEGAQWAKIPPQDEAQAGAAGGIGLNVAVTFLLKNDGDIAGGGGGGGGGGHDSGVANGGGGGGGAGATGGTGAGPSESRGVDGFSTIAGGGGVATGAAGGGGNGGLPGEAGTAGANGTTSNGAAGGAAGAAIQRSASFVFNAIKMGAVWGDEVVV
jgi:hypothetical protein